MANVTVTQLAALTSVATDDEIGVWDASVGQYKKATVANVVAPIVTGGGVVATGGFTLTVPATGTAALKTGTPTANNLAQWDSANVLEDSAVATNNLMLLAGTQTITGDKTFTGSIIPKQVEPTAELMPDTQISLLTRWTPVTNGLLFVADISDGIVAAFLVRGAGNAMVELGFDSTNQFSVTAGAASSINIYYLGGTGYVIQNNMGKSIYVSVFAIGA